MEQDNERMSQEEMQRYLDQQAREGKTESEALKNLAYVLGISFPSVGTENEE